MLFLTYDIILSIILNGTIFNGPAYVTTYQPDYSDKVDTTYFFSTGPIVISTEIDIVKLTLTVSGCNKITFYITNPKPERNVKATFNITNELLTRETKIVYSNPKKNGDLTILNRQEVQDSPFHVSLASFFDDGGFSTFLPFHQLLTSNLDEVSSSIYSSSIRYRVSNKQDYDSLQGLIAKAPTRELKKQEVTILTDTLNALLFDMEKARHASFWNWYQSQKYPDKSIPVVTLSLEQLPEDWQQIVDFFTYMALDDSSKNLHLVLEYWKKATETCHPSLYFLKRHFWMAVKILDIETRNQLLKDTEACKYLNNLTYSN